MTGDGGDRSEGDGRDEPGQTGEDEESDDPPGERSSRFGDFRERINESPGSPRDEPSDESKSADTADPGRRASVSAEGSDAISSGDPWEWVGDGHGWGSESTEEADRDDATAGGSEVDTGGDSRERGGPERSGNKSTGRRVWDTGKVDDDGDVGSDATAIGGEDPAGGPAVEAADEPAGPSGDVPGDETLRNGPESGSQRPERRGSGRAGGERMAGETADGEASEPTVRAADEGHGERSRERGGPPTETSSGRERRSGRSTVDGSDGSADPAGPDTDGLDDPAAPDRDGLDDPTGPGEDGPNDSVGPDADDSAGSADRDGPGDGSRGGRKGTSERRRRVWDRDDSGSASEGGPAAAGAEAGDQSEPLLRGGTASATAGERAAGPEGGYRRPEGLDVEPGASTLVQCSSQDGRKHSACQDLLGLEGVSDGRDVLLVRYRRIEPDRLERITDAAHRTKLITVGYSQTVPDAVRSEVEVASINNPNDITRLGILVSGTLESWAAGDREIIMCYDSLNVLLKYKDVESVFRFLHVFLGTLQGTDAIAHFHVDPLAGDPQNINTLKPLFDDVITIDSIGVELE